LCTSPASAAKQVEFSADSKELEFDIENPLMHILLSACILEESCFNGIINRKTL